MQGGLRTKGIDKVGTPDRPLVSVITPTLNSERFLEQTIRSVLDQTYDNIEYIVVDGGSADRTLNIIREYEDRISCWVCEPDNGIYDAMNKGVSLARGDIVGIINSDDLYALDTVELVVKASRQKQEACLFFGDVFVLDRDGRVLEELKGSLEKLFLGNTLYHPTCFLRREIYKRHEFDIDFPIAADYEFMLRLYFSGVKFHHIDKPLAYFRIGGDSYNLSRALDNVLKVRRVYNIISDREYIILMLLVPLQAISIKLKYFMLRTLCRGNCGHTMLRLYKRIKKRIKDYLLYKKE